MQFINNNALAKAFMRATPVPCCMKTRCLADDHMREPTVHRDSSQSVDSTDTALKHGEGHQQVGHHSEHKEDLRSSSNP